MVLTLDDLAGMNLEVSTKGNQADRVANEKAELRSETTGKETAAKGGHVPSFLAVPGV
jgi:hypothetical protein